MNSNQDSRQIKGHSNRPKTLSFYAEGPDDVFEDETPIITRQSYFRVDVPSAFQPQNNETIWESAQSILFNFIQLYTN